MMKTDDSKPDFNKVAERALRLLARRDHSARELRQKLRQKLEIDDEMFNSVLNYLSERGYMAKESDLTARWVRQWRSEGRGRHWINGKLKTKGLPPAELRDDEEELESARQFAARKLGSKQPKSLSVKEKAKLSRSMISRGFSISIVATVLKD